MCALALKKCKQLNIKQHLDKVATEVKFVWVSLSATKATVSVQQILSQKKIIVYFDKPVCLMQSQYLMQSQCHQFLFLIG